MAATALHPEIEPSESGRLDAGEGHSLYWERSGKPGGKPFLFLHGGPGSGATPRHRRYADPAVFETIQFDQRGCGRSAPLFELEANDTARLIADIERLRDHLGVARWIVCGNSWGSTLSLAYAQAHPGRVTALIVLGVFLGSREELDWFYGPRQAGAVFPDALEDLMAGAPAGLRGDSPAFTEWALDRMRAELAEGAPALDGLSDPETPIERLRESLFYRWSEYEERLSHMQTSPQSARAAFMEKGRDWLIAHSLIEAHYFANGCFLAENQLLRDAPMLTMPVVIIQSRYDMVCPMRSAWRLRHAVPQASLRVLPRHGHAMGEPSFRALRETLAGLG